MKKKTIWNAQLIALCAVAVVLNVVFGEAVSLLKIPLLFLDTIGTILIAANFGMQPGIITGVVTNLLLALFGGPLEIPFALVNVAVAVIVALVAKNHFGLKEAVICGVLLSIVCPLIGTPIRLVLYGGFTGSGTDVVILALRASGKELISSVYWGAVVGNVVDKILSCLLVCWLMKVPQLKRVGFSK